MKSKLEILNETVEYIRRNGRAIQDSTGFCAYRTDSGGKCAVGRCIPDKLSPEYRRHKVHFWDQIQLLHDQEDNWEPSSDIDFKLTLTEEGEELVQIIIEDWNLDECS